jgi:DNA-directed RNA polymerase sigma subunit (sigma70/sigma32)
MAMTLQFIPDFDEDLHQFLDLARQFPALDPGEAQALLARRRTGDDRAVARLVNANLRHLVDLAVINEERWRHVQIADLFTEGVAALEAAIRAYDASTHGPLHPYVIGSIQRAIDAHAHAVRVRRPTGPRVPARRSTITPCQPRAAEERSRCPLNSEQRQNLRSSRASGPARSAG